MLCAAILKVMFTRLDSVAFMWGLQGSGFVSGGVNAFIALILEGGAAGCHLSLCLGNVWPRYSDRDHTSS